MSNSRRYFETRQQQQLALGALRDRLNTRSIGRRTTLMDEFYRDMNMIVSLGHKHPDWRGWMAYQRKIRLSFTRVLP